MDEMRIYWKQQQPDWTSLPVSRLMIDRMSPEQHLPLGLSSLQRFPVHAFVAC